MRLIDGDDLFTKIRQLPNTGASWLVSAEAVFDAILKAPTIEPQRMKGRWIGVTKTGGAELWKCSECGELELEDSYYCPNCGADMRGEDDADSD